MRISDWSSDVCSSDLLLQGRGIQISLGIDELQFVSIAQRHRGSSLGAYTDPVEICRCWLRSVAFDGAFKVAVVHGRDQFCIHLQQRFAAGEHNETLLCRPSRSEEHTSELQSLKRISYALFC